MEQRRLKSHDATAKDPLDRLLEERYAQLMNWAAVLARGDDPKAQEMVQELCLYFAMTKPDLTTIHNVDGYLYTCLRHIYLSAIARASREARHIVSTADFDSFEFAAASARNRDPLDLQNELRCICAYVVWRKETSKSAAYFILIFFHGYSRAEVAELARLPLAAIYNKLKIARTEIKLHIEQTGKVRLLRRELPLEPPLSWSLVPPATLFAELRRRILDARVSRCLPEEDLLAHYDSPNETPIPCELLSHLVSCEQCLAVIDRYFRRPTLKDREALDVLGSSSKGDHGGSSDLMRKYVRRYWGWTYEYRPQVLSIAVDGRIIAFHDIRAERNMLTARLEHPDKVQFVEILSEHDIRLALLPVGDLPPLGEGTRTQFVTLSDMRWLELCLMFDGLGLNTQVSYFDPALASQRAEDVEDSLELEGLVAASRIAPDPAAQERSTFPSQRFDSLRHFIGSLVPSTAMAWAVALMLVLGATSYLLYHHATKTVEVNAILKQSLLVETASLAGQTEHQILHIEESSADGRIVQQGMIDVLKDGDGHRYLRRLYDSKQHLVAAEWQINNSKPSSAWNRKDKEASDPSLDLLRGGLWNREVSAQSFSMLKGTKSHAIRVDDGYELTTEEPIEGWPQLVSATLTLDRNLHPVRESLHLRTEASIRELRLVQISYERSPAVSIPDASFNPEVELHEVHRGEPSRPERGLTPAAATDVQLAQLQIAVLYQLSKLDADIGDPIEIARSPEGHIRVSGTIADPSRKQKVIAALKRLNEDGLIELQLGAPHDLPLHNFKNRRVTNLPSFSVVDVGQTEPQIDKKLRSYFHDKEIPDDHLESAVRQYSNEALRHAQLALQHAYALHRLGNSMSETEFRMIGPISRMEWAEMVHRHASDLGAELLTLRDQLSRIKSSDRQTLQQHEQILFVDTPAAFNQVNERLLLRTQELNDDIGRLFASNTSISEQSDTLLETAISTIPLAQVQELNHFANELSASAKAVSLPATEPRKP